MYGDNTNSSANGVENRDKEFMGILENTAGRIQSRLKNYDPQNDPLKRSHLKLLWDIVTIEAERVGAGESELYTGLESPIKAVGDWGEPKDSDLTTSLRNAESYFHKNYPTRRYMNGHSVLVVVLLCAISAFAHFQVFSQGKEKSKDAAGVTNAVIWEPVDVGSRDLYLGPGGAKLAPDLDGAVVIGRQPGGNNPKYRLRDNDGNEWVAKVADESQPETAAVRLLWGIGYKTEVNYLVPELTLGRFGTFNNVRLEARPKGIKRGDRWMWVDNPFVGTKEFDGLKIMMAMFNNWDLKDENNAILITDGGQHYVISDLGASFGGLAKAPQSRSGRSVNDADDYSKSVFINGARDGVIDFAYTGMADQLMKGIKVESGRWLADLLLQLSDKQIRDAFRAAHYSDEKAAIFAAAFKARINSLDQATRSTVAAQ
jgi:hypothetical protein